MKHFEMAEWMGVVVTGTRIKRTERQVHQFHQLLTRREWSDVEEVSGWITGFRTYQEGIYSPWHQECGPDGEADEVGAQLCPDASVAVALVVLWPSTNPVPIRLSSMRRGGTPKSPYAAKDSVK